MVYSIDVCGGGLVFVSFYLFIAFTFTHYRNKQMTLKKNKTDKQKKKRAKRVFYANRKSEQKLKELIGNVRLMSVDEIIDLVDDGKLDAKVAVEEVIIDD